MRSNLITRFVGIAALLVLLASSVIAAKWMIGDFYGERVALSIDNWLRDRITPSENALDQHLAFIEQARQWSPENARYMELEARLRLLRLPQLLGSDDFTSELEAIVELHRQAAEKRPHWSFSWANLSSAKSMQGELDAEFNNALVNVLTYGPYEQAALDRVINAGISARQRELLSSEANQAFLMALANSAEMPVGFARGIRSRLQNRNLLEELCPAIPFHTESGRQRICGTI